MVRIVYDINVLLSAVLSGKGSSYLLVRLSADGKTTGYVSKTMMQKFREILARDFAVPPEKADQIIDVYLQFLKLVDPHLKLSHCHDDEDNRVIECAVYVKADYLASWDPHLTELKNVEGVEIDNPGKILKVLKEAHRIE